MTICFYATPIIFDRTAGTFSPKIASLLSLNPFTHFVEAFRVALLGKGQFNGKELLVIFLLSSISLILGATIHSKLRTKIIYHL
jgi:ABC-type polysaccharide/polyol phosphate export permease